MNILNPAVSCAASLAASRIFLSADNSSGVASPFSIFPIQGRQRIGFPGVGLNGTSHLSEQSVHVVLCISRRGRSPRPLPPPSPRPRNFFGIS